MFLQAPPGEAFPRLARALRAEGLRVRRINFNGGDWVGWSGRGRNFNGPLSEWPGFLAAALIAERVTDLVLFGDCRPMHRLAIDLARRSGVRVHVFEEGYIRPDWVTLEDGGVNGHSSLPRRSEWYLETAAYLPGVPELKALPSAVRERAWQVFLYYAACVVLAPAFLNYRTHRPVEPILEALGWIGRMARRRSERRRTHEAIASLANTPYFLLPLQLDSDAQIRVHSTFGSVRDSMEQIVASFAEHAPAGVKLVVKQHPLDCGLTPWRRLVRSAALRHRISEWVVFCELGDIGELVSGARGVVTVNSTTGALALAAGVPVLTLGAAIYDLPGLTFQGSLDAFWSDAVAPDARLYEAFRRVLADRCLVPGGFYGEEALARLSGRAMSRLCRSPYTVEMTAMAAPCSSAQSSEIMAACE